MAIAEHCMDKYVMDKYLTQKVRTWIVCCFIFLQKHQRGDLQMEILEMLLKLISKQGLCIAEKQTHYF